MLSANIVLLLIGVIIYISIWIKIFFWIDLKTKEKIEKMRIKDKYTDEIRIDFLIKQPFKDIEREFWKFLKYADNSDSFINILDEALHNTEEHKKIVKNLDEFIEDYKDFESFFKKSKNRDDLIKEINKILDRIDDIIKLFMDNREKWHKEFTLEKINNFINNYNILYIKIDFYYDINKWGYHEHLNLSRLIEKRNTNV